MTNKQINQIFNWFLFLQFLHVGDDRDGSVPSRLLPDDKPSVEAEPVQPQDSGRLDDRAGNQSNF